MTRMEGRVRKMAKKTKSLSNVQILETLWGRLGISVVLLALAYVVASLAIDSGSLLQYAVAVGLIYFGITHFIRGIHRTVSR